jgi:hypothetical protein
MGVFLLKPMVAAKRGQYQRSPSWRHSGIYLALLMTYFIFQVFAYLPAVRLNYLQVAYSQDIKF